MYYIYLTKRKIKLIIQARKYIQSNIKPILYTSIERCEKKAFFLNGIIVKENWKLIGGTSSRELNTSPYKHIHTHARISSNIFQSKLHLPSHYQSNGPRRRSDVFRDGRVCCSLVRFEACPLGGYGGGPRRLSGWWRRSVWLLWSRDDRQVAYASMINGGCGWVRCLCGEKVTFASVDLFFCSV